MDECTDAVKIRSILWENRVVQITAYRSSDCTLAAAHSIDDGLTDRIGVEKRAEGRKRLASDPAKPATVEA